MKHIVLLSFSLFIFAFSISDKLYSQTDIKEIIILHTNDMHAKIDNMSKLAYYIDYYRTNYENVFLFSAGDNFTGNPIVDRYPEQGYPMIDLMNRLKFDISVVGNHEFDYGQETLNKRREQADFEFISANIFPDKEAVLKPLNAYHKFNLKKGISIGVLGLTQVNKLGIPDCSPLKIKHINFRSPLKIAKTYINYQDSSDIFIALTHLGYKEDKRLAKKVPIFDAVIGGHSHTFLQTGEFVNNTLICQAGSYIEYLGVLKIQLINNVITSKSDTLIALDNENNKNIAIRDLIDTYNDNPDLSKVIGTATEDLNGKDELGAMLTDAIRDTLKVDIALQNNGGIRIRKIPKGNIIVKQIFELSPFGNTLVEYNLSPKQIEKLITYAYNLENENEIQVSGLNITLELNSDKKLKHIILTDTQNKPLSKETYSVAINNYMSAAYGLSFLKNGKEHPIVDAENTIRFIRKQKSINYKGVKRIKIIE